MVLTGDLGPVFVFELELLNRSTSCRDVFDGPAVGSGACVDVGVLGCVDIGVLGCEDIGGLGCAKLGVLGCVGVCVLGC